MINPWVFVYLLSALTLILIIQSWRRGRTIKRLNTKISEYELEIYSYQRFLPAGFKLSKPRKKRERKYKQGQWIQP